MPNTVKFAKLKFGYNVHLSALESKSVPHHLSSELHEVQLHCTNLLILALWVLSCHLQCQIHVPLELF